MFELVFRYTTVTLINSGVDLIFMMSHFLDTCDDTCILRALVVGFCRLVLHGHIKNDDIIEKLLLKYFNPITGNETHPIFLIVGHNNVFC